MLVKGLSAQAAHFVRRRRQDEWPRNLLFRCKRLAASGSPDAGNKSHLISREQAQLLRHGRGGRRGRRGPGDFTEEHGCSEVLSGPQRAGEPCGCVLCRSLFLLPSVQLQHFFENTTPPSLSGASGGVITSPSHREWTHDLAWPTKAQCPVTAVIGSRRVHTAGWWTQFSDFC